MQKGRNWPIDFGESSSSDDEFSVPIQQACLLNGRKITAKPTTASSSKEMTRIFQGKGEDQALGPARRPQDVPGNRDFYVHQAVATSAYYLIDETLPRVLEPIALPSSSRSMHWVGTPAELQELERELESECQVAVDFEYNNSSYKGMLPFKLMDDDDDLLVFP